MTSQIWDRDINVAPLSAEFDAHVAEFNGSASRMAAAQSFFLAHNSAVLDLRDPEAPDADEARRQMRLRCSNQSGRLALCVAHNQLTKARMAVAKQVTKIVTTMPHIADDHSRSFLGVAALNAALECERVFRDLSKKHEQQNACDTTIEKGPAALKAAYGQFAKDGTNSQAPHDERPTDFVMFLIPIRNAEVDEGRLIGGDVSDELVTVGNSAVAFLNAEAYRTSRNQYFVSKTRLDEPTYARRLLAAAAQSKPAAAVVKNQQAFARIAFLGHRTAVTREMQQIGGLVTRLGKLVERLGECITRNGKGVPILKMVAKNNVLAADAIVRGLRLVVANWDAELLASADLARTAEGSLCDELATVFSQEPFDQSRWIYGVDGRYIDLSRHAKQ